MDMHMGHARDLHVWVEHSVHWVSTAVNGFGPNVCLCAVFCCCVGFRVYPNLLSWLLLHSPLLVHHLLWTVSPQSCGCVWSWGFQEVGAALKVGPDPVGSMSSGYAHPGKGHVRTQPEVMSAGGTPDPPDHQDSDLPVPCSGTPASGLWEREMDVAEAEPAGVAWSQADRGTLSRGSHAWGAVASVAARLEF